MTIGGSDERKKLLQEQLKIGDAVNEARKKGSVELLLRQGKVFTLTDKEGRLILWNIQLT